MTRQDIPAGQEWVIDLMRPEDAPGVAQLFRSVYGEGYPVRTYISPEILVAENQAKNVISSVARTPAGDIVGHNALFHSAPSARIYESGAGLVHKHYRGGKGIFGQLFDHGVEIARGLQVDAVWGEPVTNTVFAQKMNESHGMVVFAVEADLMPAAAYVKEASAGGRVGTLMTFHILNHQRQQVYLPAVYAPQLKTMYGELLAWRDSELAPARAPEGGDSEITAQYFEFAQVVRLSATRLGPNFARALAAAEEAHLAQGARVLQIWLPLTDPAGGWAVDILRARGYFLGGPLPYWFGGDGLLLQKTVEPPHWDAMQIAFPRTQRFLELVQEDWRAVTGQA
ncbi:MAG: hypothetical protein KQJ78_01425 [Deltaproteobacteria bacterium]|nr:hypothetical protein [Deltaproteobacteria bacterium]